MFVEAHFCCHTIDTGIKVIDELVNAGEEWMDEITFIDETVCDGQNGVSTS